jgi:hypothetical protein
VTVRRRIRNLIQILSQTQTRTRTLIPILSRIRNLIQILAFLAIALGSHLAPTPTRILIRILTLTLTPIRILIRILTQILTRIQTLNLWITSATCPIKGRTTIRMCAKNKWSGLFRRAIVRTFGRAPLITKGRATDGRPMWCVSEPICRWERDR